MHRNKKNKPANQKLKFEKCFILGLFVKFLGQSSNSLYGYKNNKKEAKHRC